MDRKFVFKALVGSHNYNLNVGEIENTKTGEKFPASDKDYKVFVLPTFEDLYKGNMYTKQTIGDKEDLDMHDIRKLPNLLYKANINFVEVLFSNEIIINDELGREQKFMLSKIFENKDELARMNLPYLYNACGGMFLNKMKLLKKGTDGTQHLVDTFGYDTKQALHAYRVLDFVVRFANTDFEDFKKAMTYNEQEREFMLDIKHGFFTLESFENFIKFYHEAKFKQLKEKYHSFKPNQELKDKLDNIIMELVKLSL